MDERNDMFVRGKPEQLRCFAIIGGPAGNPLRPKVQGLRCEQQVERHASRRQQLFLRRYLVVFKQSGDDDQA